MSDPILTNEPFDVTVCGGGPAGMAAAWAAASSGARTLLLERNAYLGGVLPQCVHDGFGLYTDGRSSTGPRYAELLKGRLGTTAASVATSTVVLGLSRSKDLIEVDCIGTPLGGPAKVLTRTLVLASGCRERTRGQMRIPGSRPAGIMTAGCGQYMMNIQNQKPGTIAVILGSGDIGLIMARRMKLEGIEVRLVLGQAATGLYRNHVQCISEMNIPLRYGWTVCSVHGRGRLKGVTIAPINEAGVIDYSKHEYVRCNTLLVAAGLIPERDLDGLDEFALDGSEGVFLAGNVSHIHDLVDGAVAQGASQGIAAARQALCMRQASCNVSVEARELARTMVPEGAVALPADGASSTGGDSSRARVADVIESGIISMNCTGCPSGCPVEVQFENGIAVEVLNAGCNRGEQVIIDGFAHPRRLFTGTVKYRHGDESGLLPVYTSDCVEVGRLFDIAKACRRILVTKPVELDGIVTTNIAGTGVDLLASRSLQ